jgi:hypothetical protein
MKRVIITLIVLACAVGLADTTETDWSPVVYPMQRLPLIFSHGKHLQRGATCITCHATAPSSRSAVDNLIPTEAACRACHPIDRNDFTKAATPVAACVGCHPGWAPGRAIERVYLTPTPLKFDHSAHAATACEGCHTDMRAVDLATTRQLPTMASCLSCHTNGTEERHCTDCHMAKLGGLLETRFAHGALVPHSDGLGDDHGPTFARDHKQQARQVGATCTACHDRSECVACHQGVVKPMEFHPGNYLLTHAVDARRGRPDCSACHRAETFCVACHERSGLGTRSDSEFNSADPNRAFHPTGWASPGAGPNLHAQAARRNITACASCHREEDCLTCHSAEAGGVRASPHPPGWRSSARCRALDRGNRRMCLRCHVTQDEVGCDWSK